MKTTTEIKKFCKYKNAQVTHVETDYHVNGLNSKPVTCNSALTTCKSSDCIYRKNVLPSDTKFVDYTL